MLLFRNWNLIQNLVQEESSIITISVMVDLTLPSFWRSARSAGRFKAGEMSSHSSVSESTKIFIKKWEKWSYHAEIDSPTTILSFLLWSSPIIYKEFCTKWMFSKSKIINTTIWFMRKTKTSQTQGINLLSLYNLVEVDEIIIFHLFSSFFVF